MNERCSDCGRKLMSRRQFYKTKPEGYVPHWGSGLCYTCGSRGKYRRRNTPRKNVPREVVLEEWDFLEHDRTISASARIRQAAPRLGMKPAALAKALERAGVQP